MTQGWKQAPLIEFAELVSTGPFGSMLHKSDYVSDGVPLINPTNIVDDAIVADTDKQVGTAALARLQSYVLRVGDVVVGRRGEIGRCAVVGVEEEGWVCGTGCFFVRPKPVLNSRFLAQLLRSPMYRDQLEQASTGATMKNMSNTALAGLPIAVPSPDEQRRIVAILDEAFEGIATAKANAEKNLQNARELFQGALRAAFQATHGSWERRALVELCLVDWGNTDLTKASYVESGEFLAVSAAGCDGRISHAEHRAFTPVMSAIGAQCGRMFLPTEDFTAIKNTITLTPRAGVCSGPFLFRLLTAIELPKRGAAQPFIAKGDIQSFTVLVPKSLPEQESVVDHLDQLQAKIDDLSSIYQRRVRALDELKKSLLHQAFTGQL